MAKKLGTAGQVHEQLKDGEDQRRAYQHRAAHSHGTHRDNVELSLKLVEGQIRNLKALRLA